MIPLLVLVEWLGCHGWIEFDTVINQVMFLMTAWNVPEKNKFHAKLRESAREAHDWRHA